MPEQPQQQETPEAAISPEQIGASIEQLSKEAAVQKYQELHAETVELSQQEATERDAALEKIKAKLQGTKSSAMGSLTDKMGERKTMILSESEQAGVGNLQQQLRAMDDVQHLGETTDEEYDAAFETATTGPLKQEATIETPIELDLSGIPDKGGKKALEQVTDEDIVSAIEIPTQPTLEDEVDTAFEDIQKPPEQKAA
jgi:hypothetical protein